MPMTLADFLGATYHQDWSREYTRADDALTAFVQTTPRDDREAIASEIERLLSRGLPEHELDRTLDELGANYRPEADGWTNVAWLRFVAARLRDGDSA